MDLPRLVIRVLFAYLVALVFMRIAGHREIKHVDVHSFIVALIMGDLFDDLFWLEVSAAQFLVALGSLFILHMAASLQWFHAGRRAWTWRRP